MFEFFVCLLQFFGGLSVQVPLAIQPPREETRNGSNDVEEHDFQVFLQLEARKILPLKEDVGRVKDTAQERGSEPTLQAKPQGSHENGQVIEPAVDIVVQMMLRVGGIMGKADQENR